MSQGQEPQVGARYVLVRVAGTEVSCVRYERFRDGSAIAVTDAAYARAKGLDSDRYSGGVLLNADEGESAWRRLWEELAAEGFVEASAARARGLVGQDWVPPGVGPGLRW